MFQPVPNPVDFVEQEHAIQRFWEDTHAFDVLRRLRAQAPVWSFIDGPITANNPMGVHHGWGRTYKDLFQRFKAMQGFRTRYQNGFDCQGLWVEVNVEKEMGFRSKRDIEAYGLAEFVLLCKQRVLTYAAVQTQQSQRLGYWMDWNRPKDLEALRDRLAENPAQSITLEGPDGPVTDTVEALVGRLGMPELGGSYFTFSDENNYTIWHMLKSCHERGWIYKGHDVMPWCARCGTGLSQHEIVTEGYQELTHPTITLRFPLRDRPGESLLVWTTTPWTLTSNVAAAVGPDLDYVQVRQGEENFYLSRGTLHMLQGEHQVVRELKGREMEGWTYRGPFDELPAAQANGAPAAHRVVLWDEVGEDEGTGIVHIAPGCGAEDFALSKMHGLPVIAPIDEAGVFVEGFDWLTGQAAGDVPKAIFEDLQRKGLAYRLQNYTHRYPVCWRCSSELVFRLVDEWFISMGAPLEQPAEAATAEERDRSLRLQLIDVVDQGTTWYPRFGKDRELDWLHNMQDWMISKKRYWGLALPIWECTACGHFEVLGSREELRARAVAGWETFEGHSPHRPYIDAVEITCTKCGSRVRRIADVGNPWLDAGIVAMSTLQYRRDRSFWETWFPADLISESFPGQFRNWFYSLLAMSTILERRAPFRNVFTYATLLAEDGSPMHKSAGNMVEFNEAADRMGVDVMRWQYCDHQPGKDLLFGYHRADLVRRQFLLPLWNAYSFFVTYARLDGWKAGPAASSTPSAVLDRWIRARLQQTVADVTASLEAFEPDLATERVNRFLDHLTNWYLRRSRRRFWARSGSSPQGDADKDSAYATLYVVLTTLCRLVAPFVPFVTESIYQNLVRSQDAGSPESVHHTLWPESRPEVEDAGLLEDMELILRLASLGHAARNAGGRKLRQPLAEAAFSVGTAAERLVVERYASLLADELNVKKVRLLDAATEAVEYRLNPLPKQLGQKYESRFPLVREALLRLDPAQAASRLNAGQPVDVIVNGETLSIQPDEVEVRIQARSGLGASADGPYLAAVAVALTPDLEAEGLAREFIRRLQDLRKQAGLEIADRIVVQFRASPRLAEALSAHHETIAAEALASRLEAAPEPAGQSTADFSFEGETARVGLSAAAST
jgi:isoleucyl-tRNA synthetase